MSLSDGYLQGLAAPIAVPGAQLPTDLTAYAGGPLDVLKMHEAKYKALDRAQRHSDKQSRKMLAELEQAKHEYYNQTEDDSDKVGFVSHNPILRRQYLLKAASQYEGEALPPPELASAPTPGLERASTEGGSLSVEPRPDINISPDDSEYRRLEDWEVRVRESGPSSGHQLAYGTREVPIVNVNSSRAYTSPSPTPWTGAPEDRPDRRYTVRPSTSANEQGTLGYGQTYGAGKLTPFRRAQGFRDLERAFKGQENVYKNRPAFKPKVPEPPSYWDRAKGMADTVGDSLKGMGTRVVRQGTKGLQQLGSWATRKPNSLLESWVDDEQEAMMLSSLIHSSSGAQKEFYKKQLDEM